jgi:hypothetical protein
MAKDCRPAAGAGVSHATAVSVNDDFLQTEYSQKLYQLLQLRIGGQFFYQFLYFLRLGFVCQ